MFLTLHWLCLSLKSTLLGSENNFSRIKIIYLHSSKKSKNHWLYMLLFIVNSLKQLQDQWKDINFNQTLQLYLLEENFFFAFSCLLIRELFLQYETIFYYFNRGICTFSMLNAHFSHLEITVFISGLTPLRFPDLVG